MAIEAGGGGRLCNAWAYSTIPTPLAYYSLETDVKYIVMCVHDAFYPLQESRTTNAPERLPQEVAGRPLESSDVHSAVNDERERQMEERRGLEEKHQVVENQLKRQG